MKCAISSIHNMSIISFNLTSSVKPSALYLLPKWPTNSGANPTHFMSTGLNTKCIIRTTHRSSSAVPYCKEKPEINSNLGGGGGCYAIVYHWGTIRQVIVVCACVYSRLSWWRHQMETFSALLVLCSGNSPVIGEFPEHRAVTRGFLWSAPGACVTNTKMFFKLKAFSRKLGCDWLMLKHHQTTAKLSAKSF